MRAGYKSVDRFFCVKETDFDDMQHDALALMGALGYPIPAEHNGKMTDGTVPVCGMCSAMQIKAEEAERERDALRELVADAVPRMGDCYCEECRKWNARARAALKEGEGK